MLLNHLSKYLESVERAIRNLEGAYVERYEEEILTVNRVNLRIRIHFQTGHMLELNEAIIGKKNQIMRPLNFCRNLANRHSGENRNPVISNCSGPRLSPG